MNRWHSFNSKYKKLSNVKKLLKIQSKLKQHLNYIKHICPKRIKQDPSNKVGRFVLQKINTTKRY